MTGMLAYTLVGIILYLAADWILVKTEHAAGRKFAYRNLVFFVIIMLLALASFALIRLLRPDL